MLRVVWVVGNLRWIVVMVVVTVVVVVVVGCPPFFQTVLNVERREKGEIS